MNFMNLNLKIGRMLAVVSMLGLGAGAGLAGCTEADQYLDGGDEPTGDMGAQSGTLPCEVSTLLHKYCVNCHGSPPAAAPMALVSYADLTATSQIYPKQKVAERALARMADTTSPMPPAPAPTVTVAEQAMFQAWVSGGLKSGPSCQSADMGTGSDMADPFSAPPVCSSGKTWTTGPSGVTMHPGMACITCHSTMAKSLEVQIGGTVYPTGHEPDNCIGLTTTGLTVEVTDSTGKAINMQVNSSGNFAYTLKMTPLKPPFTAKVKQAGRERAMQTPQMSGDCNSCHTQSGANGAPGRIVAP